MKSISGRLQRLLPHGVIILSLMFAVFLILDEYNPLMQFVDSNISRVLLGVLVLLSIITACLLICCQRRCKK
jgi:predicted tellurium resistance membrane protein TerC